MAKHQIVECANCHWKGNETQTKEIQDFWERAPDAGEEMPAGECPKCGALAFVIRPDYKALNADLLAALEVAVPFLEEHDGARDVVKAALAAIAKAKVTP